jgi:hypothetical protein
MFQNTRSFVVPDPSSVVQTGPVSKSVNGLRGFSQTEFYRRLSVEQGTNGRGNHNGHSNEEPKKKREVDIVFHAGPYRPQHIRIRLIELDEDTSVRHFLSSIWYSEPSLAKFGNPFRFTNRFTESAKRASSLGDGYVLRDVKAFGDILRIRIHHTYKGIIVRGAEIIGTHAQIAEWIGPQNGAPVVPKLADKAVSDGLLAVGEVRFKKDNRAAQSARAFESLGLGVNSNDIQNWRYEINGPVRYSLESLAKNRIR